MALRTIMMASCSERSVSSVNCSAPPLRMMVHVFAFGQPLKKLYLRAREGGALAWASDRERERAPLAQSHLSPPTWTSSNSWHCPRTSSVMALTEVWMEPPQAWGGGHMTGSQ